MKKSSVLIILLVATIVCVACYIFYRNNFKESYIVNNVIHNHFQIEVQLHEYCTNKIENSQIGIIGDNALIENASITKS